VLELSDLVLVITGG